MAFTIYEYESVTPEGEPIQPPSARTTGCSTGEAYRLAASTLYAGVVSDADMYLRISPAGSAATSADHKLLAGETYGFPVRKTSRPYLYGTAV